MKLFAIFVFQALLAAANRKTPYAAELLSHAAKEVGLAYGLAVHFLARPVMKGEFGLFILYGPNQRFMGIAKPRAHHVGRGVRFPPDNVIDQPVAKFLKRVANGVNALHGTDYPEATVLFQYAAGFKKPRSGESCIISEV